MISKWSRQVTLAAARAHAIPVIVAYNLPDRDACGKLSPRPAARPPRATRSGSTSWPRRSGTGDDIVVVEPDGLPDIVRGLPEPGPAAPSAIPAAPVRDEAARRAAPGPVYLDAGNPGMFADPAQLAGPLETAGIRYGRGFSANVSNFQWTADVVTWSQQLEHALGGTGRSGHRHQPQRPRTVHRSRRPAVVQSSGPGARAGPKARPGPGRDRRLPVDQGSRAPATERATADLRPASTGPQYAEALEQQRQQA